MRSEILFSYAINSPIRTKKPSVTFIINHLDQKQFLKTYLECEFTIAPLIIWACL
jgi:hypothetical protein